MISDFHHTILYITDKDVKSKVWNILWNEFCRHWNNFLKGKSVLFMCTINFEEIQVNLELFGSITHNILEKKRVESTSDVRDCSFRTTCPDSAPTFVTQRKQTLRLSDSTQSDVLKKLHDISSSPVSYLSFLTIWFFTV